jgi:hypothetical protein
MWWSVANRRITRGWGTHSNADVQISGLSNDYLLTLAGRRTPTTTGQSSLTIEGDVRLGERFLASWRLI